MPQALFDPFRYTDTLLWLRAQYLNEAKTAMQERDIDNGRWVKQRKSEKYELRKLKYLEKQKREQESASSHDVNSENRQRNHSHGSDSINQIGSDQERLSHQSSLQETGDDVGVSGDFPDPSSKDLSDQPAAPDRSKSHSNDHVTQLKQLQSVDSSENDHHLMESHPDGVDEDDDDEDDQEDITTSYEVYFDFFVSPTLLLYANLLKTIIVKCDRITSWNLLNQIWLETLPHIKNNLAKYNFADHMLRYSIKSNAHLRVIQFFLCVGGSDPNSQDRWLRTPLHYAVVYNRPDVLRFLLLIGADSNVPGAICIPSGNGSSSMVNYNLYTPRELMINLNMSSSSPSMMILKERCCLWCQKLFQSSEKTTNQSSNGTQTFARAYCGLCTIPFCIQCIHSHKCVYSIDKYEYHKHYVEEYLHEVADDSSSQSSPTSQPALKDDLNANKDEADDETSPLAPELVDDNLHEYTIERIPQETETEFADDQSEIMNGRDSLDSGFGSADQLDVLNSEELVDDIEEYYGSDDEVVQSNEEEQGSTNPISLVKKFLGKTRKTTPVREETITVTEEVDLSAAPSKPSSIPLPWRRNSQVQTETEDIPNESGGKSMLSKARTLSIDLGMVLHGDKKEKKIEDLQTPNKVPPTEIKKKLGMSSIGDSLKKFTKGIGRSAPVHQPPEEVTSYLYNDEPVAKFTSDGIPFYWVGYQETQFIALQSWQILLLPIIYQTEKYYDTVQIPHRSPPQPQGNSRNETLLSPSSVGSSIGKFSILLFCRIIGV